MPCLVDIVYSLVLSIWNFVVASEFGRYFLMLAVISAGHPLKYPHCTASFNLLISGIKYSSCRYVIKSRMLVDFVSH